MTLSLQDFPEKHLYAYAKFELVDHLLYAASVIRKIFTDRIIDGDDAFNLEKTINRVAQAGYPRDKFTKLLSDIRIWKTITPHPTEHLTARGTELFRQLIDVVHFPEDKQERRIREIAVRMLSEDIVPESRASMDDELAAALVQAAIHRKGMRRVFIRINDAMEKYPDYAKDGGIDLLSGSVRMDIALRIWHAGDADGKVNAERTALLKTMITMEKAAIDDHLEDILSASRLCGVFRPEQETAEILESLSGPYNLLGLLKERIEEAEKAIARNAYTEAKQKLECLHKNIVIPERPDPAGKPENEDTIYADHKEGKILNTGRAISREICRYLHAAGFEITENLDQYTAEEQEKRKQARARIHESTFLLRQSGLSAAKIETRHNGGVYKEIMDNLFRDTDMIHALDLSPSDMILLNELGFSGFDTNMQRDILQQTEEKFTAAEIRDHLFTANPYSTNEEGYPVQTHEYLERFSLMALNDNQFGPMAIISDADEISADIQLFLAQAFGLKNLIHTPLNEDYRSMSHAPQSISDYAEQSGDEEIRARMEVTPWIDTEQTHILGHMVPCSDSVKKLGLFVRYLQYCGITKITETAVEKKTGIVIKWGNGFSPERGGGNPRIPGRFVAKALNDFIADRRKGYHFDRNALDDRTVLQMATFSSNTEQGRAMRMFSATPALVENDICGTLSEMLCRNVFDLEGYREKVADYPAAALFVPGGEMVSDNLRQFVERNVHEMMLLYARHRDAVGEDESDTVLNLWAQTVCNPKQAGFANNGARADSKVQGTKGRGLREQRAIGSNIWLNFGRTCHDGYFTAGEFLLRMHTAYKDGLLKKADIESFTSSGFWRYHLFALGLVSAVRADPACGFAKLGRAEDWNFDRALETGAGIMFRDRGYSARGPRILFINDAEVADIEAMQALIYRDHALFLALSDAFLGGGFDRDLDTLLNAVRPDERGGRIGRVRAGPVVNSIFPFLREDIAAPQDAAFPAYAVNDAFEILHKNGTVSGKAARTAAAAVRAATAGHLRAISFDEVTYGISGKKVRRFIFAPHHTRA